MKGCLEFIIGGIFGLIVVLSVLFAFISMQTLQNITPVDSLVKLADTEGCYTYIGWKNGHILKNLDTEELTSVWKKPIIRVQSCGNAK